MIQIFKEIDNLSPNDFEIFVMEVFVSAGWTDAYITQLGKEFKHGDGGVDIYAYKNKKKYAIEVKQRSLNISVDVGALNQLVTGAKLSHTNNMILVTNSYFTSEVKIRALRLGVELIDRDALQSLWLEKHSEIGREIKPRRYQETVINDCLTAYSHGKNKLLLEMATGLGKTYTVAHIVKRLINSSTNELKVLFIAHQVEILLQSVTSFKNVLGVGLYSFSACFDGSTPENTDFVFATFDTLYSKLEILTSNQFDIIVVDEAHHTPAKTYSQVVENFRPKLLIGLTATPFRTDGSSVIDFFGGLDGHIGKYDLVWALKHNKLAYPKYLVMLDDINQERIDKISTGLSLSDIDKQLFLHKKDEEIVRLIEKTIIEKNITDAKGIVFCKSIHHINHLLQFFKLGTATCVHSKMQESQRRENIRKFREENLSFILVCDLFNEGIDIPETNILVFMRATSSKIIWLQQLGRGLRKTATKEYVHVLDFVGSIERLNEIKNIQKSVRNTKIDYQNWEPRHKDLSSTPLHDSTLEVEYNQSAAQVLVLLEKLQYRLSTRENLIKKLQQSFIVTKNLPKISEIETLLFDISVDQIATFFDSYYQFMLISLPEEIYKYQAEIKLKKYISEYYNVHGVYPSPKGTCSAFKYRSLLEFCEQDVLDLVEEIDLQKIWVQSLTLVPDELISSNINIENPNQMLFEKCLSLKIESAKDIRSLNVNLRNEIKSVFKSEFLFYSKLKEYKDNKGE